jgi:DNA modification methylase
MTGYDSGMLGSVRVLPRRRVRLCDLKPNPKNPRVALEPGDPDFENIRASLKQIGLADEIVWNEATGRIVGGHQRVAVLRAEGAGEDDEIDVKVVNIPDEREEMAAAILLNKAEGRWDYPKLLVDIDELDLLNVDGLTFGFDEKEILALRARHSDESEDDGPAPEKPDEPDTRAGDLYVLGRHRLLCGDATDPSDVSRLLDGSIPALMVTDPPYGVEYDPLWRTKALYTKGSLHTSATTQRTGAVPNDDRFDWTAAWSLFPGDIAYVWHGGIYTGDVVGHLRSCGFEPRSCLIWRKPRLVISRGHYHWQHEPLWYAVRAGRPARWVGDRKQSTIWDIGRDEDIETRHGTQKPVECMARPMRNHDAPAVYDPFVGSGTSIVAAEQLERRCLAMDVDPGYCDVSVARWERLTGHTAERIRDKAL